VSVSTGVISIVKGLARRASVELSSKGRCATNPNGIELSDLMFIGVGLDVFPLLIDYGGNGVGFGH